MSQSIEKQPNVAVLILAGGASKRLGRPKQFVLHNKGSTLIKNVIKAALGLSPKVFVVLGAHFSKIHAHISDYPITVIENSNWEEGMGSSIRVGMEIIEKQGDFESVLLTVCDQPALSVAHFWHLFLEKKKSGKGIAASAYGETLGVPALFSAAYFSELLQVMGDKGAKKLLLAHQKDMIRVAFPEGHLDIDTEDDLKCLES